MNFSFLLFFTTIFIFLSGCRRTDHAPLSTKNEVVLMGEMIISNPNIADDIGSYRIHCEVWQSLNMRHPKTHELIPVLGSLPSVSADKLTYSYKLDPRALWSDGSKVTAEDIIFTFKSVINPYGHAVIDQGRFRDLDSVWSPQPDSICIRFSKIKFNHDYDIADVFILPKRYYDSLNISDKISWESLHSLSPNAFVRQAGEQFSSTEKSQDFGYFIGSGPYIFTEWSPEKIILKKNPHYWAQNIPWLEAYPERIIYRTYWNSFAAATALRGQDIDMEVLSSRDYIDLSDSLHSSYIRLDTVYDANITCIAWNTENPVLASNKVRKALTMLLDRDAIISQLLHGFGKKAEGPISFIQPGWSSAVHQSEYDPAGAKKILEEDGWIPNQDGTLEKNIRGKLTPLSFSFLSDGENRVLLVYIEEMRKAGIKVSLNIMDYAILLEYLRQRHFDAVLNRLSFDPNEPDLFEDYHSSQRHSGGNNISCYANHVVDSLIEQIEQEFDSKKRNEMEGRIQQILAEDQPLTYLYSTPKMLGWVDRFDNVQKSASAPWIDPRYMIVKGSGVQPIPH